jgi:DeoR/GlpR family transcriptional regulator of sugar metabolism
VIASQRYEIILKTLAENENVRISELHTKLKVTEMTVRRDLDHLEKKGLLERTHGGASKIQRIDSEFLFAQKSNQMKAEKRAISRCIPELLEDNETVFINSGTTVLQAAAQLKGRALKIITNNPMLTTIDLGERNSLVILGGEFRRESHSIVGDDAIGMLRRIIASTCLIGVDGFSARYGLTSSSYVEASINRTMIEQTRGKVVVLADHTKIGRVGPFLTAPMDSIDILVTTEGFPDEYRELLQSKGITILAAK